MTVIKRTGYVSTSKCDAMVAALPELPDAAGKEYRNSDAGGDQVSVYKILRYYSYPETLKTVWKANIPTEVLNTYLVSTFMKIPATTGILYPTTPSEPSKMNMNIPVRAIGCFLSISLTDGNHLYLNDTKYEVDKGDALLFDGTYTYKTDTMSSDALWNVNMVPTWKMSTYGA